jgi:hypothetical protein
MEVTMRYCLLLPSLICLVVFTSTTYAVTVHVPDDFPTIQAALDSCASGDTIIVRDGTYTGDGNRDIDFTGKAIVLMSENGPEVTIIDCEGAGRGFHFYSGEDSSSVVHGFTIKNGYAMYGGGIYCVNSSPTITGNTIEENTAGWGGGISCSANSSPTIVGNNILSNTGSWPPDLGMGGGIYSHQSSSPTIIGNLIAGNNVQDSGAGISIWEASAIIRSNVISGNTALHFSGGIDLSSSSSIISGNIISNNSASGNGGGGISFWYASATMNNNTIVENNSLEGGGIGLYDDCDVTVTNMIFWNNSATTGDEIWIGYYNSSIPSILTISYSDVEWGQDSVFIDTGCTLNWGDGMINVDPLFRDPEAGDFHLTMISCYDDSTNSPCIDTGHPDSSDVTLDCDHGLGTDRADMGAYGGRGSPPTSIKDSQLPETIRLPKNFSLFQNYPNPFNPSTTITFDLPGTAGTKQAVNLTVYDMRGRLVRTLIDSALDPGNHKIHWNGKSDRGQSVASGIYLYRLKAAGETFTRKMTVLK